MGRREILGLELAGEVVEAGSQVRGLSVGDRVYGLSGGGGYAEMATLHQSLAMPIPDELTYCEAASIPEVFFTANTAVRTLGETLPGERILIHAGGSGVGIAAIQIARLIGAEVWITAGSEEKCERARELGADMTINYREQDFAEVVREQSGGAGVNVILDVIGRDYWEANLRSLATAGRLVLVGLMGGAVAETNLGMLMQKRLRVHGTVMRSRPLIDRAEITRDYRLHLEPAIVNGEMKPVIDSVFPLGRAAEAHQYMAENRNFRQDPAGLHRHRLGLGPIEGAPPLVRPEAGTAGPEGVVSSGEKKKRAWMGGGGDYKGLSSSSGGSSSVRRAAPSAPCGAPPPEGDVLTASEGEVWS